MKGKIKKYWFELINGINRMFKEFFNEETNKKQRANMWSFSRLVLAIPILITSILAIITSATPLFIATSSLVLIGEITDIFDGRSARKHKSTSDFGKLLDQVVDKLFSLVVILTLTFINPLSLVMLLGEAMIVGSTVPYKLKYKNIPDTSTLIGKIKQFPLSIAFILSYLSPLNTTWHSISTTLISITFLFQSLTSLSYLKRNHDWVKETNKNIKQNNLVEIEQDFDKGYEKAKTKEIRNNNIEKNINNNVSKKELYINLRNTLNEVIISKTDNLNVEEKNKQKTKRI